MTESAPRYHLIASILAGATVLVVTILATNYGTLTPARTLQTALANTLALNSVGVEAAGSYQLTSNGRSQLGSLALSGTLTDLQQPTADWTSQLSLVMTDLRTPTAPLSESRDLELQVIDETAYFRLNASETLIESTSTPTVEIGQWYRLTTEPSALGLTLASEQITTLRTLLTNPKLWSTVTDADSETVDQHRLTATLDWQVLATALPELAFWSQVFTADVAQIEFLLATNGVEVEQLTIKLVLTQPESNDIITLDLAVLFREQNQVPLPVAPVAIDTLTELPALNLLN